MRKANRLVLMLLLAAAAPAGADRPSFNVTEVTPVGSWAEREQVTVNQRGRKSVTVMRQKMLQKTQVEGETHYWVETEVDNYKVSKKGQRKRQGDAVVMKVLLPASALNGDPGNILNNLGGYGKEIIMQAGDAQPMRIREGGMMAGMMLKAMGVKVEYQFASAGNEKVTVPAGEFKAEKFTGSGSVETRVLMSKMSVQSDSQFWLSRDVPFGMVKMSSVETVNGKPQTTEAHLAAYGNSGATSAISGEPMDMFGGPDGGLNLQDLIPGG